MDDDNMASCLETTVILISLLIAGALFYQAFAIIFRP